MTPGLDRRALIRRAAVVGAAAWTAPVILDSVASPAGALTGGTCYIELNYTATTTDPCVGGPAVIGSTTANASCQPAGWPTGQSTLGTTCFTMNCAYREPITITLTPGGACAFTSLTILDATAEWLDGSTFQSCATVAGGNAVIAGGGGSVTISRPNSGSGRHWGRVRVVVSCA